MCQIYIRKVENVITLENRVRRVLSLYQFKILYRCKHLYKYHSLYP